MLGTRNLFERRQLKKKLVRGICVLIVAFSSSQFAYAQDNNSTILTKSGPDAPNVVVIRDDRVATLEMDYEPGNPWTHFELGEDGLGPVGYQVKWTPLSNGTSTRLKHRTRRKFKKKITAHRRTQIQPLENDQRYYVRVDYINRLGERTGDFAYGIFDGGDSTRVDQLRSEMTGFFDDFNQPEGLPDERNWNTSFSQTNDPAMQAFFINPQFHSHTLVGTPRQGLFGDRGQTTHRIRNKLHLGDGETRRIVFDIDGVDFAARAIWYLDLVSEEVDINSHVNVGGGEGVFGHPATGLRFSLTGQQAAVYGLNAAGEQLLIEENLVLDFDGVQTFPNVRRSVEILLSQTHITMKMDGLTILDSDLSPYQIPADDYTVLWTAFGYNTMKVAMPYFLIHWDNFGFDGPASTEVVHNYRSQIAGTDLVFSQNFAPQTISIDIPDDLTPTNSVDAEAFLIFTQQMDRFDFVEWTPQDAAIVNGVEFPIAEPTSNATPPLSLDQLVNINAPYSTTIPLGRVGEDGTAPLLQGLNEVVFSAANCAFHNVHIEVRYPSGSEPEFTSPDQLHSVPVHHHFPKVGLPARIAKIGNVDVDQWVWYSNYEENFNAEVSGFVDFRVYVNAERGHSDTTLSSNYKSASLAAAGENPGVRRVELWIRPNDGDESTATLVDAIDTAANVPAPQLIHEFSLDTTLYLNGIYEVFLLAEDGRGVLSIPAYGGVGEQTNHSSELNGYYYPLHITINN